MLKVIPMAKNGLVLMAFFFFVCFSSNLLHAQETGTEGIPTDEETIASGRSIFRQECQMCHQINQKTVGPALKDVTERRPLPWLIAFIHNSQQVIQSGDEYAVALFEEYNKTPMPSFQYLSDDEVLSVLAYIQNESQVVAAEAQVQETATDGTGASGSGPSNQYINIILIGVLVVLVLILIVLAMIIATLTKYLKQRGEPLPVETTKGKDSSSTFKKFVISSPFIGILAFILIAVMMKAGIDQLYLVGVQQGYAPDQPVWFSHKVHAGTYQIDCNYCHTGAQISANASIPAVNICMNCHNPEKGGIITGTITGDVELKKVIDAYQNNEPIQWVRIHNLPDLSYFNHAQHVNVGGVDCETCHGQVEEMDVVQQHASLTMGWCIDCHRTTPLNVQGNEYYDELMRMHEQLGKEALLVLDIGGTECSKCHY